MPISRLSLILLMPLLLVAQGGGERHRSWNSQEPDPHFMAEIEQWHVRRFKEHLSVSQEKAQAMAARWTRYATENIKSGGQSMTIRSQFDEILRGPGTDEEKNARVKPLLDQFLALRQQQADSKKSLENDLRVGLNPIQQVRMILIVEDIQRRLNDSIRMMEHRREYGPRGSRPQ